MQSLLTVLRDLRRQVLVHRRGLAALSAAAAVLLLVQVFRPPPPATVPVWTLGRDVAVGDRLELDDLRQVRVPAGLTPRPRIRDPDDLIGREVIVPLQRGQVLPTSALLGPGSAAAYPGLTVMTVRLPDADVAARLRTGDRIDLWATDPRGSGQAERLVAGARVVLGVRRSSEPAAGTGAVVLLAVPEDAVSAAAAASTRGFLSVAWNR